MMFDRLREYLAISEAFLSSEEDASRLANMEHLERHGRLRSEVNSGDMEAIRVLCSAENEDAFYYLLGLEGEFPSILRRSFFVMAYSVFEYFLAGWFKSVLDRCGLQMPRDIRDLGAKRVREHLKAAGIDLPSGERWDEILAYNKLRNCVVHAQGNIESGPYARFLMSYVSHHRFLRFIEETGEVWFERGFCEEALDNFELFLAVS